MAKTMKRKSAMGRGLGAILRDPENDINSVEDKNANLVVGNIIELPLDSIEVNPFQPRTSFNEETLRELSTSIRELGVIQPITVRKLEFNKYQLISGERRFRASRLAGLETIPAYIRIANDQESLEMALVENIQRHDLDPIEIALSYQRLIDEINLTQEQMSDRVGKKRSTITNYLRLLKLDPVVQTGMRDGFISMGHGKAITSLESPEEQIKAYKKIIEDKLSVRASEDLVKKMQNPTATTKSASAKEEPTPYIEKSVDNFKGFFNSNVSVKMGKNGKGSLIIPFRSEEDFKRIQKLIVGEN